MVVAATLPRVAAATTAAVDLLAVATLADTPAVRIAERDLMVAIVPTAAMVRWDRGRTARLGRTLGTPTVTALRMKVRLAEE